MDVKTIAQGALTVGGFLPGPIKYVAIGAGAAWAGHDAWQAYRERGHELGSVVKNAIISSAQAQSVNQPAPIPRPDPVRRPGERDRTRRNDGRPAAERNSAPDTVAKQPTTPAPAAAPAPVATQPEGPKSSYDQRRQIIQDRIRDLTAAETAEGKRGHYGPLAGGIGEKIEKAQKELREVDRDEAGSKSGTYTMYGMAAAAGAAFLGYKIAGAFGARAAKGAVEAVTNINSLGKAAQALDKTKGILAGTPRGDAMKGIVAASKASIAKIGEAAQHVASTASKTNKISAVLFVEGGASTALSYMVDDPNKQLALRAAGLASLGGAAGLKLGSAGIMASAVPAANARALAALKGGAARLERETAGGAHRASVHRVVAEVARAKKELIAAATGTAIKGVKGKQAVAAVAKGAPTGPKLTRSEAARIQASRSAAGKLAADKAAANRAFANRGAFELGKLHGAASRIGEIASPAGLAARARALGIRGRSAMSAAELRNAVVKADHKRRAVRGQGVHVGGKGFANPKTQAAAKAAQGRKYDPAA